MTTKQMDYILELAQTRNFNRAAENLYISQPTMTYQIQKAEEELGFRIFDRSGKGASLTPAGAQFVLSLRRIREELRTAAEQGQNFSARYQEEIRIVLPIRSALFFLPDAIRLIMSEHPTLNIAPAFDWYHGIESFLQGDQDILFAQEEDMRRVPDVTAHPLFESRIYLVCQKDDPLAKREIIHEEDLAGRTLMVGGPSPSPLRAVQQRTVSHTRCSYFNSHDHDTSLTNVAAGRALVLSPGFLNDHTDRFFRWIPFDCPETIPCALYTHNTDQRWSLNRFLHIIEECYAAHPDFPV